MKIFKHHQQSIMRLHSVYPSTFGSIINERDTILISIDVRDRSTPYISMNQFKWNTTILINAYWIGVYSLQIGKNHNQFPYITFNIYGQNIPEILKFKTTKPKTFYVG